MPQTPYDNEQKALANARKLLEARSGNSPDRLAQILGVASDAVGQTADDLYQWLIPQTVEDVGMELSPIGKAIGLIPPKYIRPIVNALKNRVLNRPSTPYKDLVEEAIDKNPRVAAHVGDFTQGQNFALGTYNPHNFSQFNTTVNGEYPKEFLEAAAQGHPAIDTSIDLNPFLHDLLNKDPASSLRHEMTHAAQDAFTPFAFREPGDLQGPYALRPIEVGARVAQMGSQAKRASLSAKLEAALNTKEFEGSGKLDFAQLDQLNAHLRSQGLEAYVSGTDPIGRAVFKVRKIVLGR